MNSLARNCCMARMFSRDAELVSGMNGLPGEAKSVKRCERPNGWDTALYKNIPIFFYHQKNEFLGLGPRL